MFDPSADPQAIPVDAVKPILPGQRFLALIEVVLCSGLPSQLVLVTIMTAVGMSLRTADGHLSAPFVFTMSLLDTALVAGLVLFFLRAHGEDPRRVLLGERRIWRDVVAGMVLVPVVFLLVTALLVLVYLVAPSLHNVPRNPLEDLLQNRQDAAIFGVVVMIAGGVREETQRGFIVHRFDRYLGGAAVGVVLYSVVFGLGHIPQGNDAALATGLLGAIWGTVYLVRRSVVAPMVSHAGFNLLELVKYASFSGIPA